jgi:putative heme-binding domain-containing protein
MPLQLKKEQQPSKRSHWSALILPWLFVVRGLFIVGWVWASSAAESILPQSNSVARVVFIIGENEYHTWETLPELATKNLQSLGLNCSFVMASSTEHDNLFTNFALIQQADLLFISVRRRTPPKEMMGLIRSHLQAGKPLVGIRTASHAFGADPPDAAHEGWNSFDRDILGGNYQNHYSNFGPDAPATVVQVLNGALPHPVLTGVSTNEFRVTSSLYKSRDLAATVTPLISAHVEGQSASEPVAWVNNDQGRRVFYTSLGSPDDFKRPFFRRLLANAVLWSLGKPVPDRIPSIPENTGEAERPGAPSINSDPSRAGVRNARQDRPLPPDESLSRFKVVEDLQIDQVLTEPQVRQPVFMNFDERGRLWVVEYLQYPFPAGLKMLSHDSVWRAVYDKVPPPPPHHFVGADEISIYEDATGTGRFVKLRAFVKGLNIVTAVTKGRGGVWVLNPPYLLFYPDKNNDDIPDGDPEVRLAGFGLEDTHSVVNSLRWGPDGWLYGCQGSTVTAKVRRPGLDKDPIAYTMGQQIWRYHPETRRFEVFAEGGGNAFGCEIDEKGRIFSGHNGGDTRGFHYMQGAYLQKGFDKHGPLSNPYAFGYFPPMPHPAVDRFTHTFILYAGGALPSQYDGKLFGIEPLQGRVVESYIEPDGSSFKTRDLGYPVTTTDQWFKPVDIKVGPDGAIYIADWYDGQVNHYRNHEGQIDKSNGRIYRLKARGAKPIPPFDLGKFSSDQLVSLLTHSNKWFRQEALRLIGDRKDRTILPMLGDMIRTNNGQVALESLWALNLSGGLSDTVAIKTLNHADPFVRLWTVRLLADQGKVPPEFVPKLSDLAATETNVEVRAQLACSAKRLPADQAIPVVRNLCSHDEDVAERRLPLLIWWAIESHCESNREAVLQLFTEPKVWQLPLVQQHVLGRVMQRFALAGSRQDLVTCARLLRLSPSPELSARLMSGFELAFKGRSLAELPGELEDAIAKTSGESVILGLRRGEPGATAEALRVVADSRAPTDQRLRYIEILGEVKQSQSQSVLLTILATDQDKPLHPAALTALEKFEDPAIAHEIIERFTSLDEASRAAALNLLASRPAWALQLLEAVDAGRIEASVVTPDAVQKIKSYSNRHIAQLLSKHCVQERVPTTAEMQQQIRTYATVVRNGSGDPYAGRTLFNMSCALCHKLFGKGAQIGPDLTPYQRDDLETMLLNIVNPNAEIREGYETYLVTTKDGRTLSGFLADKDNQVIVLRGLDGVNQVLPQDQIREMKSTGLSLMPQGLLTSLTEEQLRNLFAYLQSAQPLVGEPPKR